MIVIFDLDNTLIHTERIKLDVFYAVAQSYGFSVDESKALYQSIRNENGRVIFSPQTFARELGQRVGVASESIETQLYGAMRNHTEKFIVDGAVDFVQAVSQSGLETYIMTLGVHAWQEDKIELIGFGEYFPKEKEFCLGLIWMKRTQR
jgi:beta-phosphoglucomutase-like phosphatase (HAD superfamily)